MHELRFLLLQRIRVAMVSGAIVGAARQPAAPATTAFRSNNERRIVRQLPPQPLGPSHFRRPVRVVQLRQTQIVQACRPQSGTPELSTDDVAAVSEDSMNSLSI